MNFLDIRNCTKEDLSAVKYIYNTCMKEISCAYIPYTMETLQDFYKIKVEKKRTFLSSNLSRRSSCIYYLHIVYRLVHAYKNY